MLSIIEFSKIICTISNLLEYMRNNGLLTRVYTCVKCDENCTLVRDISLSDTQIFQCSNRQCKARYSIRTGSLFEKSKLSLTKLMTIIYFFCAGSSVGKCVKFTKVSRRVCIQWYNYCRDICTRYLHDNPVHFNCSVQIDETALGGKRKYNRGHVRGKPRWIFGIIDNNATKCYFQFVHDRKGVTLIPIIRAKVVEGNRINSDEAPVYGQLRQWYTHGTVCHKREYVNRRTGVHTNGIENLWSVMKSKVKECRGSQGDMLYGRLNEFQYRFNRKSEGEVYDLFLQDVANYYPI